MAIRYIGSKARVAEALAEYIGQPQAGAARFVDLFCGTGAVSEVASRLGWSVHVNDSLNCATVMATARLTRSVDASFRTLGGYANAIRLLNDEPPAEGFIWREYTPASLATVGIERRYFTEANGAKIDAMRRLIADWRKSDTINEREQTLLLGDLINASSRAANTAGTFGCFLSKWQAQALEPIELTARELWADTRVSATVGDAGRVAIRPNDLVYLDPPYTKRQYAAYYHVLETITVGDQPQVEGVTGLRAWRHNASDFCYRVKALKAITSLIGSLKCRRVLLSYSDQAHVEIGQLEEGLRALGEVECVRLSNIGRYRPNAVARKSSKEVGEYLFVVRRAAVKAAA